MRAAARTGVYALLLYGSFAHNLLCIPEGVDAGAGEFRARYLGYDSALAMNQLRAGPGGPDWLSPLTAWDATAGKLVWYRSQYGLQGEVLAALFPAGASEPEFAVAAAWVFAGLTALTLAAFFASLAGRIGPLAAHVAVVLTACVPILLPFAPSLYWTTFLLFAPFVATWLAYPWATHNRARFVALLGLVAGLICVKGLCGYEYITTVILAPVAALTYHAAAAGEGWRAWLLKAAAVWAAGVAGFAAAVGLHARQIERDIGEDGLAVILRRAEHRTAPGDPAAEVKYHVLAPDPTFLPEKLRLPVRCFAHYFWLPAVASPQTWGPARFALPLGAVAVAAAGLGAVALATRRRLPPEVVALVPAAAVGFAGAVSWQALAVNHMVIHVHLNLIVFCVPFLPFAFAGFGCALHRAAERLGAARWTAALVFPLVAVVVASNAAVLWTRARTAERDDRRAVERVEAVLRGEPAGPPAHVLGVPPQALAALPRATLFGAEGDTRLSPAARGPGRPGWLLGGVVAGPRQSGAGPAARVVVVRDGRAVAARAEYDRLATVERVMGGAWAWTRFVVAVEGDVPPRVFVVTGPDGASVTEVKEPPR